MGSAVRLKMMADSLHSHNSNPRSRVKLFAHALWSDDQLCVSFYDLLNEDRPTLKD